MNKQAKKTWQHQLPNASSRGHSAAAQAHCLPDPHDVSVACALFVSQCLRRVQLLNAGKSESVGGIREVESCALFQATEELMPVGLTINETYCGKRFVHVNNEV